MKSKYEENLISLTSEASIKNMRRYVVTKPNNFVKEVPYPKLTVIQNRIFCFLISLVQPEDTSFKNVNFDIKTFSKIFDMNSRSSTVVKKAILGLRGNPVFALVNPEQKGSVALTWCHVYIEEETQTIVLRLDEELERFFLNIDPQKGFIKYPLYEIMNLSCKYSFWFYDQFKLGAHFGKKHLAPDYIKSQLGLPETYNNKYIKDKIINPVMEDINNNTDLKVKYTTVKKGTRVVEYRFTFKYKNQNEELEQDFYVSEEDTRYQDILSYLNVKAKTSFDIYDINYNNMINNWLKEGYINIDFMEVIDKKVQQWANTDFSVYLTPETLFGDKFFKYLHD